MGRIDMGLIRARGVALVLAAVVATSLTTVVPAFGSGARATAPTVSFRQTAEDTVRVTGRTAARSAKVRFDRRTGSGWTRVKTVRAHRHRYATTLAVAPGSRAKFRVTSLGRSSTFRVTMTAPASKAAPKPGPRPGPAPAPDACGARPSKADGSYWSCTFADEFSGTTLDLTKWMPNTAFVTWSGSTYACYRNDPANVNVANGSLDLSLVKLDAPAPCGVALAPTQYMAGSVTTYHLFSQQYGRFEARIRTTAADSPGLHEAFWLWPDDRYSTIDWPGSGEIDVAESFSAYPSITGSYLHYSADSQGLLAGVNAANCAADRGVWNTYTMDWSPTRIETFVNGRSCLVNTSADPAFQKRYIINLTQAIGGGTWNQLTDGTPIPATMQVDYVHVWQ
jgi:beta-glucanase (GH16 family)